MAQATLKDEIDNVFKAKYKFKRMDTTTVWIKPRKINFTDKRIRYAIKHLKKCVSIELYLDEDLLSPYDFQKYSQRLQNNETLIKAELGHYVSFEKNKILLQNHTDTEVYKKQCILWLESNYTSFKTALDKIL